MDISTFSCMRVTIVHKNRTRKPPHILSHQWQEVDVCRGKEVSEAKVTMVPFFDSRAEIIWKVLARDRLVNIGILLSVISRIQKRVAKQGISVRSCITRLTKNRIKSRKRHTFHQKKRKRGEKCCSDCENCTTIGLCLTWCQKSWDQFDEYGSHSLRYVKQVSGKTKDRRSEKYKSKFLISEVPTLWNLRTDLKKRLKDNSDEPKHLQAQRKKKATVCSPSEEWVLPVASMKEPEERKFAIDSETSIHMVSKKDLNSAELETMRISRNPTKVMTANGEFVTVMLLEETPAVLSLGKLCEDNG